MNTRVSHKYSRITNHYNVAPPIIDGKKRCDTCNRVKKAERFPRSPNHSTGRKSKCKLCTKKKSDVVRLEKKIERNRFYE
jgi:hypothetical protein